MTENDRTRERDAYEYELSPLKSIPRVQNYLGLDAAGYLLVALGHLVKAKEKLEEERLSRSVYRAKRDTIMAANFARYALAELEQEEEETCEKS